MSFLKQTFERITNLVSRFTTTSKDRSRVRRDDQMHVMSNDELVDQAVDESFPASDPPGHHSITAEDKILHQ